VGIGEIDHVRRLWRHDSPCLELRQDMASAADLTRGGGPWMQMKALVLTSTSLRHRYFACKMAERFRGVIVLSEEKKDYYVQRREESPAVRDHFKAIASAEREWFGGVEHGIEPQ